MPDDIITKNLREYYQKEIGRLLHERVVLLLDDDKENAWLIGEKIKELLQKLQEVQQ